MADVQNFGAMRVVKRVAGKTLGDVPGYLVTDASDALEVNVVAGMPSVNVVVSVVMNDVSVIQKTSPWVVAGDVSTVVTIGAVSVTGHVSIDNASTNPVQVTIQSFQTAVSVSGQVSVQNFPTAVSVTGQVSVIGPVSVTGHVSIDNASTNPVQVTVQSFQTAVSVSGQVSVQNFPTVTSVTGQVSVLGNVSVLTARVALTPATPTHVSVANTTCQALAGNVGRKGLVLVNKNLTSIAGIPIYLGLATVAVLGSGIMLAPNGVWEMDEWTFTTASIAAIASAAGVASLGIQEFS